MDPFQVALLTLAALTVGILVPVMLQLWLTLRQVQKELQSTHARIDPLLVEVREVVGQVRNATQVTSAIALAISAGVQAWQHSKSKSVQEGP